jgi:hypothetical protein
MQNGYSDTNTTEVLRNKMIIKAKLYGDLDFEVFGMLLKYVLEATYINNNDSFVGYNAYQNLVLAFANPLTNLNGIEIKASCKYDLFWMFSIKEMIRYCSLNYSNPGSYKISEFESRTYVDIDLEDVTPGLWVTGGVRVNSYNLTSDISLVTTGSATYILPYAEIKYMFGEDSFVRLTYGQGEFFGLLAKAYNIGYDAYKLENNNFSVDGNESLVNKADYLMKYNTTISLQFGFKL